MKLYGFWRSSATWRVRIALHYKGLAFVYEPVHLVRDGGDQHRPEFARINPMRQVPVLELGEAQGGVRLAQSVAILEYLEETYPAPPLLPRAPIARARARQIAEMIVSGIQPLQNTSVRNQVKTELRGDDAAWCRRWVLPGLAAVEAVVSETAGRYAVGDAISIADVCIVPQLFFARRFAMDLRPFPTLLRIEEACAKEPAFEAAHGTRQVDYDGAL